MSNRYDLIRSHYQITTPKIFEAAKSRIYGWTSPYTSEIDWMHIFSPIENMTWQVLRCFGMAPFYPQYPVGRYFLDFGNPVVKVGIECDGAEFHHDKEKDRKRDEALRKEGWIIYRIPGSDCVRPVKDEYYNRDLYYYPEEKEEILREFYHGTIEGLVKAIGIYHFGYMNYYEDPAEFYLALACLEKRVSLKDKIIHNPERKLIKL